MLLSPAAIVPFRESTTLLFNSWEFAFFFVAVFAAYHALRLRGQNVLLLAASYFFYGWWDWRFLSLLMVSTLVDFMVGKALGRTEGTRSRKALLTVSLVANLGILGFFKYFNFFVDSAGEALTAVGLEPHLPVLHVILPVGISFYTFQTLSYTIDIYRRQLEPTRNLLTFAVYVAYFPQLVAGPIERAVHLLPQFSQPRRVDAKQFSSGALLVLIGLVRKVAIADVVAGEVDRVFSNPWDQPAVELVRAVLLFSLQIYGDFAGYTDIARGISRMLGIELMENFNHPYFARNITDFWRRWHISLSTWLRDYLYIPLGGNRGSRWFVYRNLMLTMLLGGLWHGAAWTFVVWGGIHGVALVLHRAWLTARNRHVTREPLLGDRPRPKAHTWAASCIAALAAWALTLATVALAWLFFRAESIAMAWDMLTGILTLRGELTFAPGRWLVPLGMLTLLLLIDVPQAWGRDHTVFLRWPWPIRGLIYAGLVLALVFLHVDQEVAFIYFQF